MKKNILEFVRRGITAMGIGPMVLVVLYLVLGRLGEVQTLTVREICTGIVSLSILAFVAGGMNVVYQVERLPLMIAILIHGGVLYVCYLITYLINGWLAWGAAPILVFSAIFVLGYLIIWIVIYSIIKRNTATLNEKLKRKQQYQ